MLATRMNNNPVIIDTDPGIDDAMAILLRSFRRFPSPASRQSMVMPPLRIRHGTPAWFLNYVKEMTYVSIKEQVSRWKRVHDLRNAMDRPVWEFSIDLPEESQHSRCGEKFLPRNFRTVSDLLCLSPLTNLAQALRSDPSSISGIDSLIFLGRSFHGPGNVSPYAEFNVYNDPMHLMSS